MKQGKASEEQPASAADGEEEPRAATTRLAGAPEKRAHMGAEDDGGEIRSITIKVVTLEKNYDVRMRAGGTVEELREHIRGVAGIPASHRIRLIHARRMLTEGGKLLADCHI
eukprot:COSAG06_NODE_29803_length_550_cov_0.858093_1_plen_111_part_01